MLASPHREPAVAAHDCTTPRLTTRGGVPPGGSAPAVVRQVAPGSALERSERPQTCKGIKEGEPKAGSAVRRPSSLAVARPSPRRGADTHRPSSSTAREGLSMRPSAPSARSRADERTPPGGARPAIGPHETPGRAFASPPGPRLLHVQEYSSWTAKQEPCRGRPISSGESRVRWSPAGRPWSECEPSSSWPVRFCQSTCRDRNSPC